MGNEWWGKRDDGDDDRWQSNWDNQLSSKEHRAVKQGYRENKQGSEEDSLSDPEDLICKTWDNCDFPRSTTNRCYLAGFCLKRPLRDENTR